MGGCVGIGGGQTIAGGVFVGWFPSEGGRGFVGHVVEAGLAVVGASVVTNEAGVEEVNEGG